MSSALQSPVIGYTLGDQAGIGPEIMQAALAAMQGKQAEFRPMGPAICPTPGCPTKGSYLKYVEDGVIKGLDDWLKGYVIENDEPPLKAQYEAVAENLKKLKDELQSEQNRQKKIYDLLERDVYSLEEYQVRIADSKARSAEIEQTIAEVESELEAAGQPEAIAPAVQTVLERYYSIESAAERNAMLRNILEKIVYQKTVSGRTHGDEFTLVLYPKIPKI